MPQTPLSGHTLHASRLCKLRYTSPPTLNNKTTSKYVASQSIDFLWDMWLPSCSAMFGSSCTLKTFSALYTTALIPLHIHCTPSNEVATMIKSLPLLYKINTNTYSICSRIIQKPIKYCWTVNCSCTYKLCLLCKLNGRISNLLSVRPVYRGGVIMFMIPAFTQIFLGTFLSYNTPIIRNGSVEKPFNNKS